MRSFLSASLISLALLAGGCTPPQSVASDAPAGTAAAPKEMEVSVRMSGELEEDSIGNEIHLGDGDRGKPGETQGAPAPRLEDPRTPSDGPAPPPPPPKQALRQETKRPEPESNIHAATADSAGGKVDSATIQQAIAKNVASFKPCLRSDMAFRLDATISPSGQVLEARSPRSFPDDAKARDCVVLAVKRLTFDRFEGAVPARVSFELTLKRAVDY